MRETEGDSEEMISKARDCVVVQDFWKGLEVGGVLELLTVGKQSVPSGSNNSLRAEQRLGGTPALATARLPPQSYGLRIGHTVSDQRAKVGSCGQGLGCARSPGGNGSAAGDCGKAEEFGAWHTGRDQRVGYRLDPQIGRALQQRPRFSRSQLLATNVAFLSLAALVSFTLVVPQHNYLSVFGAFKEDVQGVREGVDSFLNKAEHRATLPTATIQLVGASVGR
ncbi:hypothetical protein BJ322DRAFT_1106757 [Thelephora terrestris]|uniref:Uncharacterized protein n=1 Tax=Thelephora terrestris TaxID=56493 RepID=A0A9P6L7E6_9AGAM|nr:hypothetical protein BJ322DRAFT_1106757 [Thelephora terrestris]